VATAWLRPLGLELSPTKTRIVHTLEVHDGQPPGFDFLGFTVRQYPVGKTHAGPQIRRQLTMMGYGRERSRRSKLTMQITTTMTAATSSISALQWAGPPIAPRERESRMLLPDVNRRSIRSHARPRTRPSHWRPIAPTWRDEADTHIAH
jgi:hypothetical protein